MLIDFLKYLLFFLEMILFLTGVDVTGHTEALSVGF